MQGWWSFSYPFLGESISVISETIESVSYANVQVAWSFLLFGTG